MDVSQIEFYTLDEINTRFIARLESIQDAVQPIIEALIEAAENILEAIRQCWQEFCRRMHAILAPYLVRVDFIYEELQRTSFYIRLNKWHLPHWLAAPVSRYWPRRFLPSHPFELFDKVEQKS